MGRRGRQERIADVLSVEELLELRELGLSYPEIGARCGFHTRTVERYARQAMVPKTRGPEAEPVVECERLPVVVLRTLREDGWSWLRIAQLFDYAETTVREYGHRVLPAHLTERVSPHAAPVQHRCGRCGMGDGETLRGPGKPIRVNEVGLCDLCQAEQAGWRLSEWLQAGQPAVGNFA